MIAPLTFPPGQCPQKTEHKTTIVRARVHPLRNRHQRKRAIAEVLLDEPRQLPNRQRQVRHRRNDQQRRPTHAKHPQRFVEHPLTLPVLPLRNHAPMLLHRTDKARRELSPGVRTLSLRERSLLLLADGKPLADLQAMYHGIGAQMVERSVRKSEAALFMQGLIGKQFDAIVTGRTESATWVRIFTPPAEGLLVSGDFNLDVGAKIRVKLVSTNVERGFIDFEQAH